ncbi:unnamed protein product, partial [Prorocentrum cordatum]
VKHVGKTPAAKSKNHPLKNFIRDSGMPRRPPEPGDDLDQGVAKLFLPPGAFIWRSNTQGAWCTNTLGKYNSASWGTYGSSFEAFKVALKKCWTVWLQHHALPLDHCPVEGLFGP